MESSRVDVTCINDALTVWHLQSLIPTFDLNPHITLNDLPILTEQDLDILCGNDLNMKQDLKSNIASMQFNSKEVINQPINEEETCTGLGAKENEIDLTNLLSALQKGNAGFLCEQVKENEIATSEESAVSESPDFGDLSDQVKDGETLTSNEAGLSIIKSKQVKDGAVIAEKVEIPAELQSVINEFKGKKKVFINFDNFNLIDILSHDFDGVSLIGKYINTRQLDAFDRSVLVDLIGKHIFMHKHDYLEIKEYEAVAEKIHHYFPTEAASGYYSAPGKELKPNGLWAYYSASGKLFNKVHNLKKVLHSSDLEEPDKGKKIKLSVFEPQHLNLDGEIKKQFEWLKSHFEPEETVLQYWEGTAEVRHQNPNDVWKHLEPLKHNIGKKLIRIDFEKMYGEDAAKSLSNSYNIFFEKLKSFENNQKKKFALNYLNIIKTPQACTKEAVDLCKFLCLPAFVGITTRIKTAKISVAESTKYFVNTVDNFEEVEHFQNFLLEQDASICPYPAVVVIQNGNLRQVGRIFVILGNVMYEESCIVDAIDLAFKIFVTLGIPYPVYTIQLWTLIEKAVYKIERPGGTRRNFPNIEQLVLFCK